MTKTDWDSSYAAVVEWARPFHPDHEGGGPQQLPQNGKLRNGRRWGLRLPGDYTFHENRQRRLLVKPSRLFDVQDVVRRWIRIRAVLKQEQSTAWRCRESHVALVRVTHPGRKRVVTFVQEGEGWDQLVVDEWNEVSSSRCTRPECSDLELLAQLARPEQRTASRVRHQTKRVRTLWTRLHVVERVMIPALIRLLPKVPVTPPSPRAIPGAGGPAWVRLTVEGFVFRFHRARHQAVYLGHEGAGEWVFYAAYPEEDESMYEGQMAL